MQIPIVAILVLIIGAVVWATSKDKPIAQQMGQWCFIIGLLWTVCVLSRVSVHLP